MALRHIIQANHQKNSMATRVCAICGYLCLYIYCFKHTGRDTYTDTLGTINRKTLSYSTQYREHKNSNRG